MKKTKENGSCRSLILLLYLIGRFSVNVRSPRIRGAFCHLPVFSRQTLLPRYKFPCPVSNADGPFAFPSPEKNNGRPLPAAVYICTPNRLSYFSSPYFRVMSVPVGTTWIQVLPGCKTISLPSASLYTVFAFTLSLLQVPSAYLPLMAYTILPEPPATSASCPFTFSS